MSIAVSYVFTILESDRLSIFCYDNSLGRFMNVLKFLRQSDLVKGILKGFHTS